MNVPNDGKVDFICVSSNVKQEDIKAGNQTKLI